MNKRLAIALMSVAGSVLCVILWMHLVLTPASQEFASQGGESEATEPMRFSLADLASVEIELERTECYGWCPNYKVVIQGDGTVHYTGRSFVREIGERECTIPQTTVLQLLQRFDDAGFLGLNDRYIQAVTDIPSTFLGLRFDGRANRVKHHWLGHRLDPWGKPVWGWEVMESLDGIADAIDKAVEIEQWIGSIDQRRELRVEGKYGTPGRTELK